MENKIAKYDHVYNLELNSPIYFSNSRTLFPQINFFQKF